MGWAVWGKGKGFLTERRVSLTHTHLLTHTYSRGDGILGSRSPTPTVSLTLSRTLSLTHPLSLSHTHSLSLGQGILGASEYNFNLGHNFSHVLTKRCALNQHYIRGWWINPGQSPSFFDSFYVQSIVNVESFISGRNVDSFIFGRIRVEPAADAFCLAGFLAGPPLSRPCTLYPPYKHPTPHTIHPTPHTLNPTLYNQTPTPHNPNPTPLHPTSSPPRTLTLRGSTA